MGDGGIPWDKCSHYATQGFYAKRKRGYIKEKQRFLGNSFRRRRQRGMGSTDGHHLVRVDALVRLLAKELLHALLHHGHPGLAADKDDLADIGRCCLCIGKRLLDRAEGALHQIAHQRLKLGAGHRHLKMQWPLIRIGCDERLAYSCL
ncbi:hypothetical protein ES703_93761 [subsurface metagenome]